MWQKPGTTHTTKKYENVKRVSRNSQKQMIDYLVLEREGTAVTRSERCSSYSYENLEKGKLTGLTKQDKKGDFAVLTRTCRADFADFYLHQSGTMPRITGFIS